MNHKLFYLCTSFLYINTMRINFLTLLSVLIILVSCQKETTKEEIIESTELAEIINPNDYESFGADISIDGLLTAAEMGKKYAAMEIGDSTEVTFRSSVYSVCQKKGCWMNLDLPEEEAKSFVRFKDYEFFVPKDAAGADAIVKGMAYKSETSVEELRHYAEDAGKTAEEIAAITEPKIEYTFMAEGVLLKKSLNEVAED